jgi:DnaK suppressor protein
MSTASADPLSYQRRLLQRRSTLVQEIRDTLVRIDSDRFAALADQVHDTKDHAVAQLLVETGNAELQRDWQELRDVDGALERIRQGTYATCTTCGTDIPAERLAAYPTAKRCVSCQTRHEQTR